MRPLSLVPLMTAGGFLARLSLELLGLWPTIAIGLAAVLVLDATTRPKDRP